ncbi:unnamed protein product [Ectocarpus sp. 4 AP-2014]
MTATAMVIISLVLVLLGKPSLPTAAAAKAGEKALTNNGPMRSRSPDSAAISARSLQEGNCTEDTVFVDSLITNLGYPIGGCYEMATTLLRGFPFYALGGGAAAGDAWIYVSTTGSWEIGTVDEVDDSMGGVSSLSAVCTSEGLLAEDFPEGDNGPTSSQLDGAWQCTCKQSDKMPCIGSRSVVPVMQKSANTKQDSIGAYAYSSRRSRRAIRTPTLKESSPFSGYVPCCSQRSKLPRRIEPQQRGG